MPGILEEMGEGVRRTGSERSTEGTSVQGKEMTSQLLLLSIVLAAEPARTVDFDTDIVPVLTKAGCNSGACHGAAAGRGGFHLSLFGSDPASDHESIVAAFEGRRVNLVRP